ncbi:site-specific integrase [Tardiphaga sp. 37S4]|uniref:tyrosine-type recombinase/integrase n=1 Tax=Tardiphaga sp. 37S4 TaxID=1404741 RepID=UPI001E559A51|nr:site-specific integrase [Tardiphaga sp. 37S4]UFS77175.1 site-specific integrase [Tardiphaga sp. 37S4]
MDRSAGSPKKAVAERELKKLEGRIERGEYPEKPQQPGAPTFLSAAIAYMKAGRSSRYVGRLIEHFKDTPLHEIDQSAINEAAVTLYPSVSPATRNVAVYTPVSAILHHAGIEIVVQRPKGYKGNAKTLWLSPPDAFAIIKAANALDPEMGRLLSFLLFTGCRIGEALALDWRGVSLDQRTAYIEKSKNEDPRTVRMKPELCALLEPHKRQSGKVFRFHQGGHRNFIFLNAKVTACGLPAVARPKKGERQQVPPYRFSWVTFHTFCHTWATWMRMFGGADVQGLVSTGRWRDERSAKRYTHTVAHQEWDRTDLLPSSGEYVGTPTRKAKAQ